jgi:YbgC/YbaW family acyl-CoA thioester hydrolase
MSQFETFEYQVLIQEHHLDSFGHVNNAVYVKLFEEARWDFITRNGFGLEHVKEHQVGPVILELNVRFKRELKNREKVRIVSSVKGIINSKMMQLEQIMFNAEGKISCEALFTIGMFDMRERKLVNAGADWLKAIGVK